LAPVPYRQLIIRLSGASSGAVQLALLELDLAGGSTATQAGKSACTPLDETNRRTPPYAYA